MSVVVDDNICNLCLMTKFLTPIMLGFLIYTRWRVDGGLAAGVVRQRAAGWRAVGGSLECLDLSSMCHTNVLKPTRMILMVVI